MDAGIPSKKLVGLLMTLGSLVGGYVPVIFGDSGLSILSIVTGTIGGLLGIWLAFHLSR